MVETKKQTCSCGAVNRWYYKKPAFCLKCKEPFPEKEQEMPKPQFVGNITKKYIPILDSILKDFPENTKVQIYPMRDETMFVFWNKGLLRVESTPEVFEQTDVWELFYLYSI